MIFYDEITPFGEKEWKILMDYIKPTQKQFQIFANIFIGTQVLPLLEGKGKEYSEKGAFDNFEARTIYTGLPKELILMIDASKHWFALVKSAKGEQLIQTKPMDRIKDVIVYLLLLAFMIEERVN